LANPPVATIQFNAQLAESLGQLDHFVRLLEREQELLKQVEVEALLDLVEQKTAAMRQLQAGENTRAQTLSRHGIDASPKGIAAWIAAQPESVRNLWQRYLTLAQRAQQLNAENGILIQTHMRHNQQALTVLMAASGPALYDADGLTSSKPGGRLFGSV
jgi:flagella synthesis protein FlgN